MVHMWDLRAQPESKGLFRFNRLRNELKSLVNSDIIDQTWRDCGFVIGGKATLIPSAI